MAPIEAAKDDAIPMLRLDPIYGRREVDVESQRVEPDIPGCLTSFVALAAFVSGAAAIAFTPHRFIKPGLAPATIQRLPSFQVKVAVPIAFDYAGAAVALAHSEISLTARARKNSGEWGGTPGAHTAIIR